MSEVTIDEQRRTYQHSQLLKQFWPKARKAQSKRGRMDLLRRYSRILLGPDPYLPDIPASAARRHFGKRKLRGHFKLRGWCWCCERETPDDRHHIIPLKNGGRNIKQNIVPLCSTCHREVHRLIGSERMVDDGSMVPR